MKNKLLICVLLILSMYFSLHAACPDAMNILYVEDLPTLRKTAKCLFFSHNRASLQKIMYFELCDGDQLSLDYLKSNRIHLVLCDIEMLRENGNIALSRLKKEGG